MTNSRISQPITTTINVNVPNKSPIFIVGCDRSGTTLLRLMLNQSPVLRHLSTKKISSVGGIKLLIKYRVLLL
ncbi:MAG: sulfotransferase [Waterburya sp.]